MTCYCMTFIMNIEHGKFCKSKPKSMNHEKNSISNKNKNLQKYMQKMLGHKEKFYEAFIHTVQLISVCARAEYLLSMYGNRWDNEKRLL